MLPLPESLKKPEHNIRNLWIYDFCFDGDYLLVTTQEALILYKQINNQNYQVVATYRHHNLFVGYIHQGKLIRNNMGNTRSSEKMNMTKEGNYELILENYIEQYVVPRDRERMYAETSIDYLLRNTRENELYHVNYMRVNEEGKKNYMQLVYSRVIDDMGVTRFVCGFRNIDEVIAEEKKKNALYYMAHIDSMTKLGNRRAFDEFMDSYADKKPEEELVFFCFDLNELKAVNDKHGHEAGDELITGAALCMRRAFGKSGNIFRTGYHHFPVSYRCKRQ